LALLKIIHFDNNGRNPTYQFKENIMNRIFKYLTIFTVIALLAAAFTAQAVQARDIHRELWGSWSVEAVTITQPPFPALMTFTSDGSVIADEQLNPVETPGHGNWIYKGNGKVAYTFVAFLGNPDGTLGGKIKVVGMLEFDGGKKGWSGPFKVEVIDPSGNALFSDTGTFTLTRIAVEKMP
jgi:hypothetical protein